MNNNFYCSNGDDVDYRGPTPIPRGSAHHTNVIPDVLSDGELGTPSYDANATATQTTLSIARAEVAGYCL